MAYREGACFGLLREGDKTYEDGGNGSEYSFHNIFLVFVYFDGGFGEVIQKKIFLIKWLTHGDENFAITLVFLSSSNCLLHVFEVKPTIDSLM